MTTTTEPQPELEGMPSQSPKLYLSGSPTMPEGVRNFEVGDEVVVAVRATVTKKGRQRQKQGQAQFINLNALEVVQIARNDPEE